MLCSILSIIGRNDADEAAVEVAGEAVGGGYRRLVEGPDKDGTGARVCPGSAIRDARAFRGDGGKTVDLQRARSAAAATDGSYFQCGFIGPWCRICFICHQIVVSKRR